MTTGCLDPMILLSAPLGGPGRQFAPPHDGLRPFHGAVPTGVMRSLFGLTNFLQGEKTPVSQNSLRTMQDAEPAVDLIVLVTPGMPSKVITRLEAGLPIPLFQSHSEGQHKDGTKDSGRGPAVRNQEVVLTLRPHRVSGKCILILSSESPGAIEALSLFLLENRQIKNLAEALNCGHTFPDYFQVVLSVAALETDPEAFIGPLVIEQQHILSPPSGGRQKHQNTRRMLP